MIMGSNQGKVLAGICLVLIIVGVVFAFALNSGDLEKPAEDTNEQEDDTETNDGEVSREEAEDEGAGENDVYEDTDVNLTVYAEGGWECIRPGEDTTLDWWFEYNGEDVNVDWEITWEGKKLNEGVGHHGTAYVSNVSEGEERLYVCTATYLGEEVVSKVTLYGWDIGYCSKDVLDEIPGFEAFSLLGIISLLSLVVIFKLHKIFRANKIEIV